MSFEPCVKSTRALTVPSSRRPTKRAAFRDCAPFEAEALHQWGVLRLREVDPQGSSGCPSGAGSFVRGGQVVAHERFRRLALAALQLPVTLADAGHDDVRRRVTRGPDDRNRGDGRGGRGRTAAGQGRDEEDQRADPRCSRLLTERHVVPSVARDLAPLPAATRPPVASAAASVRAANPLACTIKTGSGTRREESSEFESARTAGQRWAERGEPRVVHPNRVVRGALLGFRRRSQRRGATFTQASRPTNSAWFGTSACVIQRCRIGARRSYLTARGS